MTTHTTRRRWGAVLIGLVILAVVVVIPNLRTRVVPGVGQAAPVSGPPVVGDCVTDPIDPSLDQPIEVHAASGAIAVTYTYPQVGLGVCRASRYGEVTALLPNPSTPVVSDRANDGSAGATVHDANITICQTAAKTYIGISAAATRWASLTGGWYPSQQIANAASTPSARQHADGQHWLACLVYLGADDGNPQSFADQERYDSPLRGTLTQGGDRNRIGVCGAAADLDGVPAGCGTTHQSEAFASGGNPTHALPRADLQKSCAQVVQEATGIPDLATAGLTVQMRATADGEPVNTAQIPAGTLLTCGVITNHNRRLGGSLLALGDQPIPLELNMVTSDFTSTGLQLANRDEQRPDRRSMTGTGRRPQPGRD